MLANAILTLSSLDWLLVTSILLHLQATSAEHSSAIALGSREDGRTFQLAKTGTHVDEHRNAPLAPKCPSHVVEPQTREAPEGHWRSLVGPAIEIRQERIDDLMEDEELTPDDKSNESTDYELAKYKFLADDGDDDADIADRRMSNAAKQKLSDRLDTWWSWKSVIGQPPVHLELQVRQQNRQTFSDQKLSPPVNPPSTIIRHADVYSRWPLAPSEIGRHLMGKHYPDAIVTARRFHPSNVHQSGPAMKSVAEKQPNSFESTTSEYIGVQQATPVIIARNNPVSEMEQQMVKLQLGVPIVLGPEEPPIMMQPTLPDREQMSGGNEAAKAVKLLDGVKQLATNSQPTRSLLPSLSPSQRARESLLNAADIARQLATRMSNHTFQPYQVFVPAYPGGMPTNLSGSAISPTVPSGSTADMAEESIEKAKYLGLGQLQRIEPFNGNERTQARLSCQFGDQEGAGVNLTISTSNLKSVEWAKFIGDFQPGERDRPAFECPHRRKCRLVAVKSDVITTVHPRPFAQSYNGTRAPSYSLTLHDVDSEQLGVYRCSAMRRTGASSDELVYRLIPFL